MKELNDEIIAVIISAVVKIESARRKLFKINSLWHKKNMPNAKTATINKERSWQNNRGREIS